MSRELKIGDTVEVVKYGHLTWSTVSLYEGINIYSADNGVYWYDLATYLIGKQGVVSEVSEASGVKMYSVNGIPGKKAWYDSNQLKLISILDNKI